MFKKYENKIVVTSYSDMSNVKPGELQVIRQKMFDDVVVYTNSISRNPVKKQEHLKKVKTSKNVYCFALNEGMAMKKK